MWLSINRLANYFDVPPWPAGLGRLCFDSEIVGSRPGGAGTQFYFFFHAHLQCFNFCTWCALLKTVP